MSLTRATADADELHAALGGCLTGRCALLGVGNRSHGDDGFGPAVIDGLRGHTAVPLYDGGLAPENYVERIARHRPECVLIVDAADFGAPAATLRVYPPAALQQFSISTHAGSLELLAQYWQAACGARCALLLAQPVRMSGRGLSPAMRSAVRCASAALLAVLGRTVTVQS